MKTNLTSGSSLLVLLMVVLLLSLPLATLAQQISAETQAKRDAGADLNKLLWLGTSCAIPSLPILGLLAGSLVPQSSSRGSGGGYQLISFSDQQALGFCVGGTFSCLGQLILIRRFRPIPPSERFIGKSPEYVAVYTDVYKTRARWLRIQYTAVGCAIGAGLLIFIDESFF